MSTTNYNHLESWVHLLIYSALDQVYIDTKSLVLLIKISVMFKVSYSIWYEYLNLFLDKTCR